MSVAYVNDLYAWQFEIRYDAAGLKAVDVSYPPDSVSANRTDVVTGDPAIYNRDGYMMCGASLLGGSPPTFSGNGTLASVEFVANSPGNWTLTLDEENTILLNSNNDEMPFSLGEKSASVFVNLVFYTNMAESYDVYPPPAEGLFIYPPYQVANVGQNFTVEVCAYDVANWPDFQADPYWIYQTLLLYNASLLQFNQAQVNFGEYMENPSSGDLGSIWLFGGFTGPKESGNQGSLNEKPYFVLGTIEFSMIEEGSGLLAIDPIENGNTQILDYNYNNYYEVAVTNGIVSSSYYGGYDFVDKFVFNVSKAEGRCDNITNYQPLELCVNAPVSDATLDPIQKELSFNVCPTSLDASPIFVNLTIPKDLFNQCFEVLLDNQETEFTQTENETHVFLDFVCSNESHSIVVESYNDYLFNVSKSGVTYGIELATNSTISDFNFDEESNMLSFNATGIPETQGYCNITIPQSLINESLVVFENSIPKNYTVTSNATCVFVYLEYSHSTHSFEIFPTLASDINRDGRVDIRDIALVAKSFGSTSGSPAWNPNCDISGPVPGTPDGKIDVRDIAVVAKDFGKHVP